MLKHNIPVKVASRRHETFDYGARLVALSMNQKEKKIMIEKNRCR
jgi:hypothetical protein